MVPSDSTPRCVCVIIPLYNEAATLPRVIKTVLAQPCVAQVVIVDDCSTDGSHAVALAASDPRLLVLRHEQNAGKGAAVRTGMARATADIVLIQDADLEYDPADYGRLIQPILDNHADVVFGSRFIGSEAHRVLYFWHSLGNSLLTLLSNMVTNLNLTDMECCYKVFRRDVVTKFQIEENRFGLEPEITAKVARLGVRIYEVAVSYYGRTYAEGKKIGWKDGVRALVAIGKYGIWQSKSQSLASRLFWFVVGGVLSVCLNFGPFEWMTHAGLPNWAALAISLTFVTTLFSIWNYQLNFRTSRRFRDCLPRYLGALALCWLVSYLLTLSGIREFGTTRLVRFLIFFFVQSGVSVIKFSLYHFWVYPRHAGDEHA